jgi:hypothetical protein
MKEALEMARRIESAFDPVCTKLHGEGIAAWRIAYTMICSGARTIEVMYGRDEAISALEAAIAGLRASDDTKH